MSLLGTPKVGDLKLRRRSENWRTGSIFFTARSPGALPQMGSSITFTRI